MTNKGEKSESAKTLTEEDRILYLPDKEMCTKCKEYYFQKIKEKLTMFDHQIENVN